MVALSLKRASPSITRTPRPPKRSFESFGAIAAITLFTWSCTRAKSICGTAAAMPNASVPEKAYARRAAAISAFDGTQPALRHSPPILPFSTNTTGTPKAAAAAATERPPDPPPITQMSGVMSSVIPCPFVPPRDERSGNI